MEIKDVFNLGYRIIEEKKKHWLLIGFDDSQQIACLFCKALQILFIIIYILMHANLCCQPYVGY